MDFDKDTIYAPSTPSGGAISVIRISGKDAHAVLNAVFFPATLRNLYPGC